MAGGSTIGLVTPTLFLVVAVAADFIATDRRHRCELLRLLLLVCCDCSSAESVRTDVHVRDELEAYQQQPSEQTRRRASSGGCRYAVERFRISVVVICSS